jgi:hypothetical protein
MTFLDFYVNFLRPLTYSYDCTDVSGQRMNTESAGSGSRLGLYIHS